MLAAVVFAEACDSEAKCEADETVDTHQQSCRFDTTVHRWFTYYSTQSGEFLVDLYCVILRHNSSILEVQ